MVHGAFVRNKENGTVWFSWYLTSRVLDRLDGVTVAADQC